MALRGRPRHSRVPGQYLTPDATTALRAMSPAPHDIPHPHPASAAPGEVLAALAAQLAQATRFGLADLSEEAPEVRATAELVLELRQDFQLDAPVAQHPGPPAHPLERVPDLAALQSGLSGRLAQAQADAPQALQQWADANPGSYRRLAPAQAALLHPDVGLAWPMRCGVCQGQKRQGCLSCHGEGRRTCLGCDGKGQLPCACRGLPVRCQNCDGKGRWSGHDPAWQWQNRPMVTPLSYGGAQCNACAGVGTRRCQQCQAGWVPCRAGCQSGRQNCPDCDAKGQRDCVECAGRGELHVLGQVRSQVRAQEGVPQITLDDAAARSLLRQVDPARLPTLGQLVAVQHRVQGLSLHSLHRLDIPVRRARIRAGGQVFEVHGFGPRAEILDDGGIAAHLLQADLDRLQAAGRPGPGPGQARLLAALAAAALLGAAALSFFHGARGGWVELAVLVAALGAAAWRGAEWWAARRIAAQLGQDLSRRLLSQPGAATTARRWRLTGMVVIAACAGVGAYLAA